MAEKHLYSRQVLDTIRLSVETCAAQEACPKRRARCLDAIRVAVEMGLRAIAQQPKTRGSAVKAVAPVCRCGSRGGRLPGATTALAMLAPTLSAVPLLTRWLLA
jgi:hypothetical protein